MREALNALFSAIKRLCVTTDKTIQLVEREVDIISKEQEIRLEEEMARLVQKKRDRPDYVPSKEEA